jgi:phosphatidate cytidylyltransferase
MLGWRLLGALLIATPLLGLLWLDDQCNGGRPGIWIGPLAVLVGLLAARELNALIGKAGLASSPTANLGGVVCVLGCSLLPLVRQEDHFGMPWGPLGWTLLGVTLAIGGLFGCELARYRVPGESIARLAGGCLVVVYVGMLLSFLIDLRLALPGRLGLVAVGSTLLVVKLADTGAFFVGKSLGRKHFTLVSPNKTVEGVVGGLALAMLGAWLLRDLVMPYLIPAAPRGSTAAYLGYGASLTLAGLLGDLAESLLKRDVQQKDSSTWLRGLGGVLDVIDSLLIAAPVSFLWWVSGAL